MERSLQIAAVIFACIAAYFLLAANRDGVFVAAVLAACCYFLSLRFQIKARLSNQVSKEPNLDEK